MIFFLHNNSSSTPWLIHHRIVTSSQGPLWRCSILDLWNTFCKIMFIYFFAKYNIVMLSKKNITIINFISLWRIFNIINSESSSLEALTRKNITSIENSQNWGYILPLSKLSWFFQIFWQIIPDFISHVSFKFALRLCWNSVADCDPWIITIYILIYPFFFSRIDVVLSYDLQNVEIYYSKDF